MSVPALRRSSERSWHDRFKRCCHEDIMLFIGADRCRDSKIFLMAKITDIKKKIRHYLHSLRSSRE